MDRPKRIAVSRSLALVLVTALTLFAAPPASAFPSSFTPTIFPAPVNGGSHGVDVDANGIVWWNTLGGGELVRQDPSFAPGTGFTVYILPGGDSYITVQVDAAGNIWGGTQNNNITMFDPITTTFTVHGPIPEPGCFPDQVAFDAPGNVWFDCLGTDKIGRLNLPAGTFDMFVTPTPNSGPSGITVDFNGIVWSIERNADNVVRLDPALAVPNTSAGINEFPIPTPSSNPETVKVCGNRVWFSELGSANGAQVGYLDTMNNAITEFTLEAGSHSTYGLSVDASGNPWLANPGEQKIYGLDISTNTPATFATPTIPHHLIIGPVGDIWYVDFQGEVVQMTPDESLGGECEFLEPPEEDGRRMTGGGSVIDPVVGRVTHGFELHCDQAQGPNNLEVDWGKGNNFHLEALTSASCSDDASIDESPPVAGFDTYTGGGTGRCNGLPATASWKFTDAGEPGTSDTAEISITGGCSLSVSGSLTQGNQQAHPA